MTDPRLLETGDRVQIDCEALSGVTFEVSDVQVKDIGLVETYGVTLLSDSEEAWALVGVSDTGETTVEEIDGEAEHRIADEQITTQ